MLRIANPLGWLTLILLGLAVGVAVVWSFWSTAAVKVDAHGILLNPGGVIDVPAPADGRLLARRVEIGEAVRRDQIVADMAQPEHSERLQSRLRDRESLNDERRQLTAFQEQVVAAQERLAQARANGLRERIDTLTTRGETLAELATNTRALSDRGISTRARVLEVQSELARNQNDLTEARGGLVQLAAETEARATQNARELLANQIRLDLAERDIAVLTAVLERNTLVRAPSDGRVSEIAAASGELVRAGAALLRMLPGRGAEDELIARLYVSGGGGKRVRPGMAAQVVPSTARLQRDGFIEGEVMRVAELPTTPESMQSVLKNSALVASLTAAGPPYEVLVRLRRDPDSPSGFKWSTGRGTATPPEAGTIADAKFVVDRIPLIALVIPRAETVLGWLRP
jgi:HlyD family secretion protein